MTTSNRTAAYTAGPPENSTTTGDANRDRAAYEIARKRAEAVIAQRAASLKRCLWNQCNDRSPASRTRAYCEHVQQARTEIRKTDRQLGAEASGTRLQSGSA